MGKGLLHYRNSYIFEITSFCILILPQNNFEVKSVKIDSQHDNMIIYLIGSPCAETVPRYFIVSQLKCLQISKRMQRNRPEGRLLLLNMWVSFPTDPVHGDYLQRCSREFQVPSRRPQRSQASGKLWRWRKVPCSPLPGLSLCLVANIFHGVALIARTEAKGATRKAAPYLLPSLRLRVRHHDTHTHLRVLLVCDDSVVKEVAIKVMQPNFPGNFFLCALRGNIITHRVSPPPYPKRHYR